MIFFRADGNYNIGSGHVMRCLSIAREIIKDDDVLFLTADDSLKFAIQNAGINDYTFHTDYDNMTLELEQMQNLIEKHHPRALFVDSYYVTAAYLNNLWRACKHAGCKLIYIDDVLEFAYPCDVLINYNIYGPEKIDNYKELYRLAGVCEPSFLLGTSYVPLRTEFQGLPDRIVNKTAKSILISAGGSDPEHIILNFVKEVLNRKTLFNYHFIIGAMNQDSAQIDKMVSQGHKDNIYLHHIVGQMSTLMMKCDIAISAAGSTLYELCATQTPSFTYTFADNQQLGAECFARSGIMKNLGDFREIEELPHKLINEAIELAKNYGQRKDMANKMKILVNGKGCRSIIDKILEK